MAIAVFTTLINFVFVLCLICPSQGEQIKQPLMLLLGTLVSSTTSFEISAFLQLLAFMLLDVDWLLIPSYIMFVFSLSTTMTSAVWLSFFYNTQIVPAKRVVSIWIKKNIKVIIYSIWLFEKMLCAFHLIVSMVVESIFLSYEHYWMSVNSTLTRASQSNGLQHLQYFYHVSASVVNSHFYFCMCVMAIFNSSTIVYLCKHMHRMMVNGQPVVSPQLRRQLRVTVTCVLQGAMLICCTVLSIKKYIDQGIFADAYSDLELQHFTVIHFFMVCTTLSLGTGQAVFRQRAVNLWRRAACCCKMRKSDQEA